MDITIAHQYEKELAHKVHRLEEAILTGKGLDTFEAYREKVGELRGWRRSLQVWRDFVAHYGEEKDDDDDGDAAV